MSSLVPVVTCGDPGASEGATQTGTTYEYGYSVSYTCDSGFTDGMGDTPITCLDTAVWDGSPLVCDRK